MRFVSGFLDVDLSIKAGGFLSSELSVWVFAGNFSPENVVANLDSPGGDFELEFLAGLKQPKYLNSFAAQPDLQARLQKRFDEPSLRETYFELLRDLGYSLPETITEASKQELDEASDSPDHKEVMASLIEIYQNPDSNLPLYLLSETFVEFDLQLDLWREHHVRVVERSIGFKRGTGGSSGVGYLRSTTGRRCFPFLWEVRTYLKKEANVW